MKNKQEVYEKPVEMSRNNDYTIGTWLDYLYHQETNTTILQQIDLRGKLEDDSATMFFFTENQQKTILNFSLDSLIVIEQNEQWSIKKYWTYWM